MNKQDLRNLAKIARAKTGEGHEQLSFAACEKLVHFITDEIKLSTDCLVGAYRPINSELNPDGAVKRLSSLGYKMAYPKSNGVKSNEALKSDSEDFPVQGDFFQDLHGEPVVPSFVICPLLAFDLHGNRLGYGGGWYDRFFHVHSGNIVQGGKIGLAFSCQMIEDLNPDLVGETIQMDSWDVQMDYIVTELGVVVCSNNE